MNTVFIVDDHPVIRLAIRMLLEHEGYEIVGETDNGVDAMQMIRECTPDLVILDISIPKLDGLEVLSRFSSISWFSHRSHRHFSPCAACNPVQPGMCANKKS